MSKINLVDSIETFIKYLSYLKDNYPKNPIISSPIDTGFLFRGISNQDYSLLPSVYRTHYGMQESLKLENSLFLSFADERAIIKEFRNEARRYLTGTNIENFVHWAEYAQHYSVPTRFLDWSSNPLVALYFACCNSESDNGVVWCLHQTNYMRFISNNSDKEALKNLNGIQISDLYDEMLKGNKDLPYPVIFVPNYIDSRMSMQSSYFLLWGNDRRPLDEIIGEEYHIQYEPPANGVHCYGKRQKTEILMKLIISSDMKQMLLRSLDMLGVNRKTLFPGLDGLGEYLKWKYQFNDNDDVL